MITQPAIIVEDVSVTYDRWGVTTEALKHVSFNAEAPGWTLVSGHNGSGKSTLLGVLAGDVKPTSGRVRLYGADPMGLSPRQRSKLIAIARQRPEHGLVAGLTVEEHARLFAMTWDVFIERARNLGGQSFDILDGLQKRTVDLLSGGERQVLGLGLQLLRPSKLLLLDEPFSALDPARFGAFVAIVEKLAREKAVVQVTHEPELLRAHARQELVMTAGRAQVRQESEPANGN